jgi:hypothetical protein
MTDEPFITALVQRHVDRILHEIDTAHMPSPTVIPTINGDAQLEWHINGGDIELYINHTGPEDATYAGPNASYVAMLAVGLLTDLSPKDTP